MLIIAYFCDPTRGSEPGIAWNWVIHLSRHCRISVITRQLNQYPIEAHLAAHPLANVSFHYLDAPPGLAAWRTGKLYYPRWLHRAGRLGTKLHEASPFHLAHHLTVATINYPSFLRVPVPLVIGPVGGGESWPRSFRAQADRLTIGYEWLRSIRQRTLRYDPFLRAYLGRCSLLLAATPETERMLSRVARCRVVSMPMAGIERSLVASPGEVGERPRVRIYATSRLLGWKGLHLAIEAFARVATDHPSATFTIYGDGPERGTLERLAQRLQLAERVHFEGWLPRDDMIFRSRAEDIFVLPSLRDSGGVAVLEAMSTGSPVVCFDAGGPALMVSAECGIKIPVTTPEQAVLDLARALDRLLVNPTLVARLGEGAQRQVLSAFVWEQKARRMVDHYESLLHGRLIGL